MPLWLAYIEHIIRPNYNLYLIIFTYFLLEHVLQAPYNRGNKRMFWECVSLICCGSESGSRLDESVTSLVLTPSRGYVHPWPRTPPQHTQIHFCTHTFPHTQSALYLCCLLCAQAHLPSTTTCNSTMHQVKKYGMLTEGAASKCAQLVPEGNVTAILSTCVTLLLLH